MARKPLIEPGSVLPPSPPREGEDLVSRIVERDRERSGRRPPEADPQTDNLISLPSYHMTDNEVIQMNSLSDDKEEGKPIRQNAGLSASQLADTPLMTVSLKLPSGLNDWLDDYAHKHRKAGVKKQDLVSRAVQLLVAAVAEEEGE